ncbi:hypothetical protein ACJW30_01G177300 [Castanea mollissima]
MKPKTEKDSEDPKASQGTKKRKTSKVSKWLPILEESKEVASIAAGGRSSSKKVSYPPIPKIRVKTKVEVSPLLVGGTVPGEAAMDQPPVDLGMSGQVTGGEVVRESEGAPNPSMAKDPNSE